MPYMMATTAIHQLGDISRDEPDLCHISREDAENYIGSWVTGLGFFNVKFPKTTTRHLTDDERAFYKSRQLGMNGSPIGPMLIERH